MSLPKEGMHLATITGRAIVTEYDSGSMGFEFPVKIDDDEVAWSGTARIIIVLKDNSISENGVKSLKQTFGIDGSLESICDLCENDLPVTQVEFNDCKHETYKDNLQFKLGFLNPVGGGSRSVPADRKSIIAKYSSRFRALAGGSKPATPAKSEPKKEEKKASSTPAQPPKKGPPSAPTRTIQAPTATQDEAWEACVKVGIASNENPEPWFAAIDATFGDGTREKQDSITIQQWGQLKQKLENP